MLETQTSTKSKRKKKNWKLDPYASTKQKNPRSHVSIEQQNLQNPPKNPKHFYIIGPTY